ncbi:hypothetical protein V6N12_043850 [Hibiscus sabdariffa]|uniref:Protein transport protein Sec61 subunit gamma n=1 Tax=Hibiscus sabdariffa TaxID=183260 RepID=A0ABR2DFJ4_9ROSI
MDALDTVVDPLRDFAKDSVRLVKRCHKPDRKEFSKVAIRTAIGFVVMGFVGFFVKLIFILSTTSSSAPLRLFRVHPLRNTIPWSNSDVL